MGCHFLLQGPFPTQGLNLGLKCLSLFLCSSNLGLAVFMGLIVYHLCHLSSSFSLSFHIHYIFITINYHFMCKKKKMYSRLSTTLFYENKKRRFFSWNFQSIAVLLYWFWFFKIFCWVCKFSNLNVIILWFLWILPCSLLYFLDILLILPARISFRIQIRILTSFLYPVFCLHRFIFPCFNSNPLYCCLFFASHVLWFFLLSIHIQELKPLIFC